MPTEAAAAIRSLHVLSSSGTPSASRSARVWRSTSPGPSTGRPGTKGGDALTQSINLLASAERCHALRAGGIEKVQRHLALRGRHLGPVAQPPEMAAIAQAHHRYAGLRGLGNAEPCRELADHLAESAIAVDDRERVAVEHDRRIGVGLEPALANPLEVLADAQHAVGVVADEIGIDEPLRHRARLFGMAAAALHDRRHETDQLRRGNGLHQWISGSAVGTIPSRQSKSQPWSASATCC